MKISTKVVNPYFPVWESYRNEIELIEDIYSGETTFIMQDHDSDIGSYWWEAVETNGSNLCDESGNFVFKIEGEDYILPISVQELESKGWNCDFGDEQNIENCVGYYILGGSAQKQGEDGSSYIGLTGRIGGENQINIVGMDISEFSQVELPGGIICGKSTKKEIQNIYGKPKDLLFVYYLPGNVTIEFYFENEIVSDDDIVNSIIIRKIPEDYTLPQS